MEAVESKVALVHIRLQVYQFLWQLVSRIYISHHFKCYCFRIKNEL